MNHDGKNGCSDKPGGSSYIMNPYTNPDYKYFLSPYVFPTLSQTNDRCSYWSSCSQQESKTRTGCYGCLHGTSTMPSRLPMEAGGEDHPVPPEVIDFHGWALLVR